MAITLSTVGTATSRRQALATLIAAQVLALAPWFSGSAVLPALRAVLAISDFHATALTSAVQVSFVLGALLSALFGLAAHRIGRTAVTCLALALSSARALLAGFTLTLVSIHLRSALADTVGWHRAPVVLALGPIVGIGAMLALRRRPEARLIAGGRR